MERTHTPPRNTTDSPEKSVWQSPQVTVLSSINTQGGKGATETETYDVNYADNGPS